MTRVLSGKRLGTREVGCGVWGVGSGVWGVGCGVWGETGKFQLIPQNPNLQPLTDY